jgi:hypothetical protein
LQDSSEHNIAAPNKYNDMNSKLINKLKNMLLLASTLLFCNTSFAQLKGLKDKLNQLKGPTTVDGILGMTPEDVKKMQADSASDVLDKEYQKIKGHEDPLGIIGVYYLKYPMRLSGKYNGFVKKVLLDYNDEKKRIYVITSYTIQEKDKLYISESGDRAVGAGTRATKAMGSLFYAGGNQGFGTEYRVISPNFIVNGFDKYVFEKHELEKVGGIIEIDKGVYFLRPWVDDMCATGDKYAKERNAAVNKQDNIFFNLMTKKEDIEKMKNFDHKTILAKSCEMREKFLEFDRKDKGGFGLPMPTNGDDIPMFNNFGKNAIAALESGFKNKGRTNFKPLYSYCFQQQGVFSPVTEKRAVGFTTENIYIGRMVQYVVVCENTNTNPSTKDEWNRENKYCYFLVNVVEYVKDKSINRTSPAQDGDFSGTYTLQNYSMPYFLNAEEDGKVMRFKKK